MSSYKLVIIFLTLFVLTSSGLSNKKFIPSNINRTIASNNSTDCISLMGRIINFFGIRKTKRLISIVNSPSTTDQAKIDALIDMLDAIPFPEKINIDFPSTRDLRRNRIRIMWTRARSGKTSPLTLNIDLEVARAEELVETFLHEIIHSNQAIFSWGQNIQRLSKQEWVAKGLAFEKQAYTKSIEAVIFLRSMGIQVESIFADLFLAKKYIYPQDSFATRMEIPAFRNEILEPLTDNNMDTFLHHLLRGHTIHFETEQGIRSFTPDMNYYQYFRNAYDRL